MSINDEVEGDGDGQYAGLRIGAEEFVVYDRENHRAWIQSDAAVHVDERR